MSSCYNSCCWLVGVVFSHSFCSSVFPSPSAVSAPAPAWVAARAAGAGASWFLVRPSARSFASWVGVCLFSSASAAGSFARWVSGACGFPFCVVRRAGSWFAVSVPVFVSVVPLVAAGSLPCQWFSLGGGGSSSSSSSSSPSSSPSSPLAPFFAGVSSVGFSGSRSCPSAAAAVRSVLPLVPSCCRVSVGCASGVDSVVRLFFSGFPSLLVFSASSTRFSGGGFVAALARRSAACVRSVARGSRGLLVVAPSGACPAGVRPGRFFRGCGSGSWGSAALAVGLGRRVLLFSPVGVPSWSGGRWSAVSGASGWWVWVPASPAVVQLSLF